MLTQIVSISMILAGFCLGLVGCSGGNDEPVKIEAQPVNMAQVKTALAEKKTSDTKTTDETKNTTDDTKTENKTNEIPAEGLATDGKGGRWPAGDPVSVNDEDFAKEPPFSLVLKPKWNFVPSDVPIPGNDITFQKDEADVRLNIRAKDINEDEGKLMDRVQDRVFGVMAGENVTMLAPPQEVRLPGGQKRMGRFHIRGMEGDEVYVIVLLTDKMHLDIRVTGNPNNMTKAMEEIEDMLGTLEERPDVVKERFQ